MVSESPAKPPGAGPFLAAQRIAVLAGVDEAERVWASLVSGNPGFITSPDPRTLRLEAGLPSADPLSEGLARDRALGVLVFDPERRRRLRINGHVLNAHADAIEAADTLFIASVHAGTGADASHRGGQPGFVRVLDDRTLRIPDYAGNNMFQTLGNIAADPRGGVLFVDFDTGTTLQLTGRARILWESPDHVEMKGAERAIEVEIDEVVEIAGRGPLGWRFVDYSPFNPR